MSIYYNNWIVWARFTTTAPRFAGSDPDNYNTGRPLEGLTFVQGIVTEKHLTYNNNNNNNELYTATWLVTRSLPLSPWKHKHSILLISKFASE